MEMSQGSVAGQPIPDPIAPGETYTPSNFERAIQDQPTIQLAASNSAAGPSLGTAPSEGGFFGVFWDGIPILRGLAMVGDGSKDLFIGASLEVGSVVLSISLVATDFATGGVGRSLFAQSSALSGEAGRIVGHGASLVARGVRTIGSDLGRTVVAGQTGVWK